MIYAKLLSKYGGVFHGFATRDESDQGIKDLVLAEQIHRDKISDVDGDDLGKKIKSVDGLVTKISRVNIGVRTADCLPILFYEPKAKIVAAVHAGWKGTLLKISPKMIKKIESLGGKAKNIIAAIGPHICGSCYTIPKARVKLFAEKAIRQKDGEFHLDLALFNFKQLVSSGVNKKNIEILPYCTVCQNNLFFSFRKDKGKDYGEMLAMIGLI